MGGEKKKLRTTELDSRVNEGCVLFNLMKAVFYNESAAENVALQWNISREEQDKFALRSQEKCELAQKNGKFEAEIVPVAVQSRAG